MTDITFLSKLADAADAYNHAQSNSHADYYYGKFNGMVEAVKFLGNDVSYEFDGININSVTVNGVTESLEH